MTAIDNMVTNNAGEEREKRIKENLNEYGWNNNAVLQRAFNELESSKAKPFFSSNPQVMMQGGKGTPQ